MSSILDGLSTTQKLKALMASRGVTHTDLAEVLGVSVPTIGNRFEVNRWNVEDLKKIATAYGVEVTDLV